MHLQQTIRLAIWLGLARCGAVQMRLRVDVMHTESCAKWFNMCLLNGIKCARTLHCDRWRWNKIWQNSNVSHGNCTRIEFELFFSCYTLGPKWTEKKNDLTCWNNNNNSSLRTKTLEKTFNHQLSNSIWWRNVVVVFFFRSTKWERDAFHARNKTINTFDRRTLKNRSDEKKKSMVNNWHSVALGHNAYFNSLGVFFSLFLSLSHSFSVSGDSAYFLNASVKIAINFNMLHVH